MCESVPYFDDLQIIVDDLTGTKCEATCLNIAAKA